MAIGTSAVVAGALMNGLNNGSNSAMTSSGTSNSFGSSNGSGALATEAQKEMVAQQQINNKEIMALQNAYNAKEAELNRQWQERMSNSAYQRAVADMKAAGINPILAAGNIGASTPTGAMGSTSALGASVGNAYTDYTNYASSENSANSVSQSGVVANIENIVKAIDNLIDGTNKNTNSSALKDAIEKAGADTVKNKMMEAFAEVNEKGFTKASKESQDILNKYFKYTK